VKGVCCRRVGCRFCRRCRGLRRWFEIVHYSLGELCHHSDHCEMLLIWRVKIKTVRWASIQNYSANFHVDRNDSRLAVTLGNNQLI